MGITLRQRVRLSRVTLTTPALMRDLGQMAVRIIQARTRQGRDTSGAPFRPYSEGYATQKAAALRSTGTPDLTVSGDMLDTLQVLEPVTDTTVTIGWPR